MSQFEPIELSDSENEPEIDRRSILAPAIHNVITALGGYEGQTYRLGDEAYGCLKDLKKLLRKDDTDDERTVARIFWQARLLPNDLVPILLETAGKGFAEDKCAIACADLVTAMTWPIDLAEELKELDESMDKGTDYTQLLQSHLAYKAALLRPGVIQALLAIILPCIAKSKKERKERDNQIINVVLHLFRNLAFIKDRPANAHASVDQAEYSALQSKLIATLSQTHVLDLLLTIASNAAFDPFFNQWNVLVLEILYLLFRGVSPEDLTEDQTKRSQGLLSKLLEVENKVKIENARTAASRHSRFGTTISVRLKPPKLGEQNGGTVESDSVGSSAFVLHKQQALKTETGTILDQTKKKRFLKSSKIDGIAREDNLSYEAKSPLRGLARSFIETCFNSFLSSILKDIKSERPKITEKDHLRLLFVAKWFLEFFVKSRSYILGELKKDPKAKLTVWGFSLIAEILERPWIVWILKRMRSAMEDKPKSWVELQAGIECLTQLLMLIDCMSGTSLEDDELNDAAELLQQQIVYNGEVLDISVDSLRHYKEGVQSLKYLDSSIRLGYTLLRMLEKWSKLRGGGEMYVRKKVTNRKRKTQGNGEDGDDEQEQNEESERIINEILFTFEAFELKFAHEEITHTLVTYLARYEDFTSTEQMKRVVNLLHRQAVKAKAEGLFFKVSTLNLFKSILARQSSLPKDQSHKDLISLITFILKKFFKAVSEDPLILVEAFFPKTRGRWKQHSSWEPEQNSGPRSRKTEDPSAEVQVKKGFSWSEQLGIAIACLVENGQQKLVDWVKEILMMVTGMRQRIVEETDGSSSQDQPEGIDEDAEEAVSRAARLRQPSSEAISKFEDYVIPYVDDEHATAATKNLHLKLVFRLIKCLSDEDAEELQWYIPAAILPSDLQSSLNVINQYLEKPVELEGKKASQMLRKKTKRRRRREETHEESGVSDDEQPEKVKKKREKKQKEKQVYKSAQFIEDSDGDLGDDEAFWAREKALRERTALLAAQGQNATMRSSGTKKRKKKSSAEDARKRRKGSDSDMGADVGDSEGEQQKGISSDSDIDASAGEKSKSSRPSSETPVTTPQSDLDAPNTHTVSKLKRKPRPKPAYKGGPGASIARSDNGPATGASSDDEGIKWDAPSESDNIIRVGQKRGVARMIISDEDE